MTEINRCIYIGSIPYDQTEEQVLEIAKSVGPVLSLRLLFDKDTGKSKGYAFVEYTDHETAASAVRNLNNYSIGNRTLRCSFATENSIGGAFKDLNPLKSLKRQQLPPLPSGIQLGENDKFADSISQSLRNLDPVRVQAIARDAKAMSNLSPMLMEDLLSQNPQLSYALVEIMLLLNLKKPQDVQSLVNANSQSVIEEHSTVVEPAVDETIDAEKPEIIEIDETQKQLILQVVQLTDDQINAYPEEQRAELVTIRQNAVNGLYKGL